MEPGQQKAFDIAADVSKQLIALATGVLAITVTFSKEIFPNATGWHKYVFAGSLIFYLLSAVCGIGTLMCLAGGLERPKTEEERYSIYKTNVRRSQLGQVIFFCLATSLVIIFGVGLAFSPSPNNMDTGGASMDVKFEKGYHGRAYIESRHK